MNPDDALILYLLRNLQTVGTDQAATDRLLGLMRQRSYTGPAEALRELQSIYRSQASSLSIYQQGLSLTQAEELGRLQSTIQGRISVLQGLRESLSAPQEALHVLPAGPQQPSTPQTFQNHDRQLSSNVQPDIGNVFVRALPTSLNAQANLSSNRNSLGPWWSRVSPSVTLLSPIRLPQNGQPVGYFEQWAYNIGLSGRNRLPVAGYPSMVSPWNTGVNYAISSPGSVQALPVGIQQRLSPIDRYPGQIGTSPYEPAYRFYGGLGINNSEVLRFLVRGQVPSLNFLPAAPVNVPLLLPNFEERFAVMQPQGLTPLGEELLTRRVPAGRPTRALKAAAMLAGMVYLHDNHEVIVAARRLLGIPDLRWEGNPDGNNVSYLIGQADGHWLVVFSGTETEAQASFFTTETRQVDARVGNNAHISKGFHDIIQDPVRAVFREIVTSQIPFHGITFIGHSLGGAAAQWAAALADDHHQGSVANLICFATPALGDDAFARFIEGIPNRVFVSNEFDLVPLLPPDDIPEWGQFAPEGRAIIRGRYRRAEPWLFLSEGGFARERRIGPSSFDDFVGNATSRLFSRPRQFEGFSEDRVLHAHIMSTYYARIRDWLLRHEITRENDGTDLIQTVVSSYSAGRRGPSDTTQIQDLFLHSVGPDTGPPTTPPGPRPPWWGTAPWRPGPAWLLDVALPPPFGFMSGMGSSLYDARRAFDPLLHPRDQFGVFIRRVIQDVQIIVQRTVEARAAVAMMFEFSGGRQERPIGDGEPPTGKGREFWLYRGRDRNLLLQTLRDMLALVERDKLAEDPKDTLKLSTRELMFDPTVPGLPGAILTLTAALQYDASLVRYRPPQTGYYSLFDEE